MHLVSFGRYNFVPISKAWGQNTYQNVWRDITQNFAQNVPLKLFPATVANPDIGSVKSLHIFLKMFYQIPVIFEQNSKDQTTQNFELFEEKPN